ncbi:hypothetical protein [Roseospira goensis]|uniref:Uncharacterized protein n=1 Tax=Roseospira goensis TaxID=391922 RepID=A0A7W6S1V9_9PROT|nr:hypothetical protein [Roseospira goensis]MBB4287358.1 hypothetical protein [Roseospira goensis]
MRLSVPGVRVAAVLLLVAVLTACGLPRPFRHQAYAPDGNPLVTLRSGVGVTVRPVLGAAPPLDRLIAEDVADRLRARGIPAAAGHSAPGSAAGLVLLGWLLRQTDEAAAGADRTRVTVRWSLLDPEGDLVGEATRTLAVPTALWATPGPDAAALVARDSARALTALVAAGDGGGVATGPVPDGAQGAAAAAPDPTAPPGGDGAAETVASDEGGGAEGGGKADAGAATRGPAPGTVPDRPAAPTDRPARAARRPSDLVMAPPEVTRAPGDGKAALERALTRLFRQNGVRITDAPGSERLTVRGAVEVLPAGAAGQEQVSIVWQVLDADGVVLGEVNQQNTIPRGSLDGRWGDVAALIAEGAAMGVGEILVRKGIVSPADS